MNESGPHTTIKMTEMNSESEIGCQNKAVTLQQYFCQYILGLTVMSPKLSLVDFSIHLNTQFINCLTQKTGMVIY